MICGTVVLEDITINFFQYPETDKGLKNQVFWSVCDSNTGKVERMEANQEAFFAALAIAIIVNGNPDAKRDYPLAESVMGDIRWIP